MKFVWDEECPIGNGFIYQVLAKAYNTWKQNYAAKILKNSNTDDALDDKDSEISLPDWQWWTEYVRSTEYQELSKRNAANRSKQAYVHRAGAMPFVFHKTSNPKDDGGAIDFFELFKKTHWSAEKGWINEVARDRYEEMNKLLEESESSTDGPISEFEAGQIILGKRSGYVRGMGRSVLAPPKLSTLHNAQASKIKTLESELGDMQAKLKSQDEKMANMLKMIENLQRERNIDSPSIGHSRGGSHTPTDEVEEEDRILD